MLQPENLQQLIAKYQAGTATPEELRQLNDWYQSFDDTQTVLDTAVDSEDELAAKIKQRIDVSISDNSSKKKGAFIKRIAAAAVIVLLFGSIAIWFNNREKTPTASTVKTNTIVRPATDIAPGGNKAVLTLADGSTIVLDSAANGALASQGNISIKKLDNGKLAYEVNGKTITENDEAFYNTITTPKGGQYKVILSDGTLVWLNAASSIRFPVVFTGNERNVSVTGETYFEVAKDAAKPFKVAVKNQAIEVLGTHFNVNAYDDESAIRTTLIEGRVKISAAGNTQKYLQPGQQSAVNNNGSINIITNADTEEAVAWLKGRFQFNSTNLRTMLRQIARWYDAEVEYRGNVDVHFTGQLTRTENISKVLEKLQLTGEVHFKIEGRKIIVTK